MRGDCEIKKGIYLTIDLSSKRTLYLTDEEYHSGNDFTTFCKNIIY